MDPPLASRTSIVWKMSMSPLELWSVIAPPALSLPFARILASIRTPPVPLTVMIPPAPSPSARSGRPTVTGLSAVTSIEPLAASSYSLRIESEMGLVRFPDPRDRAGRVGVVAVEGEQEARVAAGHHRPALS